MCSEICPRRTSFSGDLEEKESAQPMIRDPGSDFEFSFDGSLESESCQSSADELFADGMILPIFHRAGNLSAAAPRRALLPPLPIPENAKREPVSKEEEEEGPGSCPGSEAKPGLRSLWGFKRSASLSSDRKSLICSLPLLSRSNSTGSVPNPKRPLQKQPSVKVAKSSSFSSPTSSTPVSGHAHHLWNQKPPLSRKATSHGSSNGANRVSPVLNVPSPYIIGTTNLFGLSSFFCNGKDKKIRR